MVAVCFHSKVPTWERNYAQDVQTSQPYALALALPMMILTSQLIGLLSWYKSICYIKPSLLCGRPLYSS